MLYPILQFLFSSFWVWAGSFLMLAVIVTGVVQCAACLIAAMTIGKSKH